VPSNVLSQRYTGIAIILHWAIAVFILFNLAVGFFMEGFELPLRGQVVGMHVSAGMSVLGLVILRILWRMSHQPPAFAPDMAAWEARLAHVAHALLYFMMVAMPLTGWSILSAHPLKPTSGVHVWGLLTLPPVMPVARLADPLQTRVHDLFVDIHSVGGWIMLGLMLLHVAGALKHQFMDRHAEFARMGIGKLR
jgi:cytochrome b561